MLIDTHCHLNMMIKKTFDVGLTTEECQRVKIILEQASLQEVQTIINVGTSLVESKNSILLAQNYPNVKATIGIHPNDITAQWQHDLQQLNKLLNNHKKLIVGIGECGMDFYRPGYNYEDQKTVFKKQIELALAYDLALVIHNRDAGLDTISILEEYKNHPLRGTIHCFSEDLAFAERAIKLGFVIGIGGALTYPKNQLLRDVVKAVGLEHIILETDAPFLPPQHMRGKQNHPDQIRAVAEYMAQLLDTTLEKVATATTHNAQRIFKLNS